MTLGASATVTRLRGERDRLDAQVVSQRQHRERLNEQVARVRRMLAVTQQELDLKIASLSQLEATLSAGRGAHAALLASAGDALDTLRQRLGELTRALPGTRRQRAARRPLPQLTVERQPPDPARLRDGTRPDERARGVDD
jgi:chromosome segregation ATPase